MATGWQYINDTWYYFSSSGAMQTGWQFVGGKWYYMDASGAMQTGWQTINDTTYFLNSSGQMVKGWFKYENTWYYFASSGSMATGWIYINHTWYYMQDDGKMTTGWQKVNGTWYYMNSSGAMQTGWQLINNTWYYMNSSGAMQTGWQLIGGKWYYMNASGAMQPGWQLNGDKWYYMYSSGAMAANTWIDGYWVDETGAWIEGKTISSVETFTWPCPGYTYISSDYGYRTQPTTGASTNHQGIDIAAPTGAIIVAAQNGTVLAYGYNSSMGNYVKLQHANGLVTVYMHMSKIASLSTGKSIVAGQTIGYVGSTGVATGPHLHFGVMLNNTYVSPWNYLSRP